MPKVAPKTTDHDEMRNGCIAVGAKHLSLTEIKLVAAAIQGMANNMFKYEITVEVDPQPVEDECYAIVINGTWILYQLPDEVSPGKFGYAWQVDMVQGDDVEVIENFFNWWDAAKEIFAKECENHLDAMICSLDNPEDLVWKFA